MNRMLPVMICLCLACSCAGSSSPVDSLDADPDAASNDATDGDAADVQIPPPDVASWGRWQVGYRVFETTDAQRGDRPVPIAVYYPAAGVPAPAETVTACSGDLDAALAPVSAATRDAAPAQSDGGFPVLVFSHGSGGSKEMYKYLLEFLASHGFVCVAPDHTGNVGFLAMMPEDMEMTSLRVTDMLWVLDWLDSAVGDEAGPLNGLVDMDRLAVAGHSYGGHVAMALAGAAWDWDHITAQCADNPPDPYVCSLLNHRDLWDAEIPSPRVKAVISLAHDASTVHFGDECVGGGATWEPLGAAAIGVPAMYIGGTADQTAVFDDNARLCYDHGSTPACLVALNGAGHLDFTDFMAQGTMSCERAHFLVRGMVLGFLDRYLNGNPGAAAVITGGQAAWADTSDFQASCR